MTTETHEKRYQSLLKYGVENGLVQPYEDELIKRLRTVYYGGVPAAILLFVDKLCNGYCYDRSMLITMGMDDFLLVNGDIKSLELKYGKESANHSWAESNGWVYDTSLGFKIEKNLYYKMEQPKINKINTKESCYDYFEYKEIINSNIEHDKYVLPMIIPIIERVVPECLFSEYLKNELELFKERINYKDLCIEVEEDMIAKGFTKKKR